MISCWWSDAPAELFRWTKKLGGTSLDPALNHSI
jgi:hypothetical protein